MSAYNPTSMTRLRLQSSASVNSLPAQTITLLASEQHCISITAQPVNNSHRLLEPRGSVVRSRLDLLGDLRVATHRSLPLRMVFPELGRVWALVLDHDHACGSTGLRWPADRHSRAPQNRLPADVCVSRFLRSLVERLESRAMQLYARAGCGAWR